MSIFDDGYHQAILDAARQPIDKPPAGSLEDFADSDNTIGKNPWHSERQNNETTSSAPDHSLKAVYRHHLPQIKPLHAKEDSPVFIDKVGDRIEPNQFRTKQWYRTLTSLKIRPWDCYLTKDTLISIDSTARENTTKVAARSWHLNEHSRAQLQHIPR
jgi:hypothetical protein